MIIPNEEVVAAARAMCIEGGFDPDEIMANDGRRWRYYVPGAEAALSAAAKVRAIREGDGAIEALKPFADAAHMIGEDMDDDYAPEWSPFITARAYRNAAKALAAIPATGGEKE